LKKKEKKKKKMMVEYLECQLSHDTVKDGIDPSPSSGLDNLLVEVGVVVSHKHL